MSDYLAECRGLVLEEIRAFVPKASPYAPGLYDLMLDYPLREAKALRPALCIASCRALGGPLEGVLKSAAVLEFYHNAFLIHDDVEDNSEKRRDLPTLHRAHGIPVAINVGDAMLALALEPLLDNMRLLGLGKALRVLRAVAQMARESAEGQAMELGWIQRNDFGVRDRDYLRMVHKKTTHYTFMAPVVLGAIVAGAPDLVVNRLRRFATALGSAFQIQDDVLNLLASESVYGKEVLGDLWEGKHTLILMHALRSASPAHRQRAQGALRKARPSGKATTAVEDTLNELLAKRELSASGAQALRRNLQRERVAEKTPADVRFLHELVLRHRSIEYARSVARRRARRARTILASIEHGIQPSQHLAFLTGLTDFVVGRDH
jgi:geranylgeranyl diphosphate synthase type II